jgi:predicted DNA-binding transcriptional regulator
VPDDRVIGGLLIGGSLIGIALYGLMIYYFPVIILQITAFVGIALILLILAWIGYTMATTPAPEPIGELTPEGQNPKTHESGSTPP